LTQEAPICRQRIKAAGPGKFRLRLRTATPLSGSTGLAEKETMLVKVLSTLFFNQVPLSPHPECTVLQTGSGFKRVKRLPTLD
jgi:hypothetical protein